MEILTSDITMQACQYTLTHTIKSHVVTYNPLWQFNDNLEYEQHGQQAHKYEWNMSNTLRSNKYNNSEVCEIPSFPLFNGLSKFKQTELYACHDMIHISYNAIYSQNLCTNDSTI